MICTGPVVAAFGTVTTACVSFQLEIDVAGIPLKVTVLVASNVSPKFNPDMVTVDPRGPEEGEMDLICGGAITTVKFSLTIVAPAAVVIERGPVVASLGTGTTIVVSFQLERVPARPLNKTVPHVVPKPLPLIVTEVPYRPDAGEMLLMAGPDCTVNRRALLV